VTWFDRFSTKKSPRLVRPLQNVNFSAIPPAEQSFNVDMDTFYGSVEHAMISSIACLLSVTGVRTAFLTPRAAHCSRLLSLIHSFVLLSGAAIVIVTAVTRPTISASVGYRTWRICLRD
jgi:hypothetical protein